MRHKKRVINLLEHGILHGRKQTLSHIRLQKYENNMKDRKKLGEFLEVWLNLVTFAVMNKKEKLIKRFRTLPKDFTFEEVETLFGMCGFTLENKGATFGSRVRFYNEKDQNSYIMHKPHPSNIIKGYMMRDILDYLLMNGYIE